MHRLLVVVLGLGSLALAACPPDSSCPDRYAYCEGDIRHYCVSHQGSVVPDFSVEWATQDCSQELDGMRCVEEGNDAFCR